MTAVMMVVKIYGAKERPKGILLKQNFLFLKAKVKNFLKLLWIGI